MDTASMSLRAFYAAVRALAASAGVAGATVIVEVSLQGEGDDPGLRVSASIIRGRLVVAGVSAYCAGSESPAAALVELRRQLVERDYLTTPVGLADEEIAS